MLMFFYDDKKIKLGRQYKNGEDATSITLDIYGHVMPDCKNAKKAKELQ